VSSILTSAPVFPVKSGFQKERSATFPECKGNNGTKRRTNPRKIRAVDLRTCLCSKLKCFGHRPEFHQTGTRMSKLSSCTTWGETEWGESTILPRLGSGVRIASPAPKFFKKIICLKRSFGAVSPPRQQNRGSMGEAAECNPLRTPGHIRQATTVGAPARDVSPCPPCCAQRLQLAARTKRYNASAGGRVCIPPCESRNRCFAHSCIIAPRERPVKTSKRKLLPDG
jgi:hypothetical protein